MEENNHVIIEVEAWMTKEIEKLGVLSSSCCIYRVPDRLRSAKETAYTPKIVSIGPLHHGKEGLKPMEEHKKRYLQDFLRRTNVSLKDCVKIVKEREERLRGCYEQTIELSSKEFVQIIVLDTIFIIEVLVRFHFPQFLHESDRLFNRPWMLWDIVPDLLLLENQLPLFIIEELFDPHKTSVTSGYGERLSIVNIFYRLVNKSLVNLDVTADKLEKISCLNVEHFVHLLLYLYIPLDARPGGKFKTVNTPSMTQLYRAGVRFKFELSGNLFDIHFTNGVLKIPKLTIDAMTDTLIRNIVAFEQCHFMHGCLSDYVVFMVRLVNTPNDVDLLVANGIVETTLSDSSELSCMISKLAAGVFVRSDGFYFASICEDLNVYCTTSWHKWKANLKQNYFNTPWTIISVVAAVFLILLTIIQAVCSIISVIN
ncbi:hypothetical protein FNV43_RR12321 [Rhamnella rubrinervis]|uniref:Uncharacterized protein n=1 Tax=Rhamnella rubrinervis TaxID=2594499 RepID=A0A8K0MIF0_9ROSA|nr:hypothetical protein FNV43_RR12321 [Rhamnella rubrinervis]